MAGSHRPRRWSIRTKTLILVAGYLVALCGVYAAFTVSLVRREVARTQERLQQTADLVATELDAYLDAGRQRLATISKLPGMAYGLRTIQEASGEGRIPPWTTLHYLFFKSPVFTGGVFLLDRGGKVLWTEPPGRPWIGDTLASQPTVAAVYAHNREVVSGGLDGDRLLDRPHAVVACPVNDPNGELEGVLGGIVDLTAPELTKILGPVSTRDGRFLEVVDQQGRVIAGNGAAAEAGATAPPASDAWMLATVPLTRSAWRVVVGQPRSIALAEVWQSQRMLLALGLGLLALAVALGAPIVNGFVRAIRTLTEAADVMSRGDLSHPVDVGPRRDELATLARAFDQMRVELARSRTALERRLSEREELIRLKEEFLASISHELRTPLNAIIGYTDMLADQRLSADGREWLSIVRAQAEHLFEMLADLLTLSGLNTGTLAVEVSPVRVSSILAKLHPLADDLCAGKDLDVVWECPAALPTIETDPLRLEQILANLLSNALKFTPHGWVVLRVLDQTDHERIVFEVSDSGIGISPDELPNIFDEFRQVDGTLTRRYGGVGMGLTLVKKLTALLAGTVAVRSQVGIGSTFTVTLPLRFHAVGTASVAA